MTWMEALECAVVVQIKCQEQRAWLTLHAQETHGHAHLTWVVPVCESHSRVLDRHPFRSGFGYSLTVHHAPRYCSLGRCSECSLPVGDPGSPVWRVLFYSNWDPSFRNILPTASVAHTARTATWRLACRQYVHERRTKSVIIECTESRSACS